MVRYALVVLLVLFPQYTFAAGTLVYQGGVVSGPGTGDVVGPASSVDNGLARYDGTTGKLLQGYTSNAPVCGDTGICTFVAPVLGTPTSGVATNLTGLPAASVLAGTLGTGAYVMDTSLTVPTLLGGTATTSDLNLKTTSGVGAAGADMHFLVGNNGATEAMTILNSGNVGIGTTGPGARLNVANTVQASERVRLSGQEFYTAGFTDTDGPTLLLGVNRANNRQLWLADSAALVVNTTNTLLRFTVGGTAVPTIEAIATDGTTVKDLALQPGGGKVGIGTNSPGQKLSVAGTLGILEGGASPSFYTIFQGGDQAATLTYTLPTAQGAANTSLTNNGSGVLSWAAAGSTITAATATVATSETTTSTTYTDLTTSGPAVTVTVGPSGMLLVGISSGLENTVDAETQVSFALSGGNTLAADVSNGIQTQGLISKKYYFGTTRLLTGLTASSTTITMKYRVSSGTGSFSARHLWVMTW